MPSRASSRMLTRPTLVGDRPELPAVQHRYDVRDVQLAGHLDVLGEAGSHQLASTGAGGELGGPVGLDGTERRGGHACLGRCEREVEGGQDGTGPPETPYAWAERPPRPALARGHHRNRLPLRKARCQPPGPRGTVARFAPD